MHIPPIPIPSGAPSRWASAYIYVTTRTAVVCVIGHWRILLRAREPGAWWRGPSGWPGPSDVYLDDRRTLATGEVWACFCVFSIMLHSSGLIGEPRDAGAFATHPHTKKPRRRRSRFKRGEGRWGSFAHLRMGMFYLKKRKATALATTTQADVDNKRQKNSHKTRTEKKAARHRHRA